MNPEKLIFGIAVIYFGLMFALEGYMDFRWPDQKIEKLRGNGWQSWWPFTPFKIQYDRENPLIIRGCGLYLVVFGLFWVVFGLLVTFSIIKLVSP